MARQKSKTEYNRRTTDRKQSTVSAIQEVDQFAEDGSAKNSQSIFHQRLSEEKELLSPSMKVYDGERQLSRLSPTHTPNHFMHKQVLQ
jgi:hypothetical protein